MECMLRNPKVVIAPQDPGQPPSWVDTANIITVIWVDRMLFNELKVRKYDIPCDICPSELKDKCKLYRHMNRKSK